MHTLICFSQLTSQDWTHCGKKRIQYLWNHFLKLQFFTDREIKELPLFVGLSYLVRSDRLKNNRNEMICIRLSQTDIRVCQWLDCTGWVPFLFITELYCPSIYWRPQCIMGPRVWIKHSAILYTALTDNTEKKDGSKELKRRYNLIVTK